MKHHSRSTISHYFFNFYPHIFLIAMYFTVLTKCLCFHKWTKFYPLILITLYTLHRYHLLHVYDLIIKPYFLFLFPFIFYTYFFHDLLYQNPHSCTNMNNYGKLWLNSIIIGTFSFIP